MTTMLNKPATTQMELTTIPEKNSTKIIIQINATNEQVQLDPPKEDQKKVAPVSTSGDTNKVIYRPTKIIKIRERFLPEQLIMNSMNLAFHIINVLLICPPALKLRHVTIQFFMNFALWIEIEHILYSTCALVDAYINYQQVVQKRATMAPIRKMCNDFFFIYRNRFFGVVWPITVMLLAVYWPIYMYDPNLITPKSLRDINFDSFISNHIMHTWTGVFIIFESRFYPVIFPNADDSYSDVFFVVSTVAAQTVLIAAAVLDGVLVYPVVAVLGGNFFWHLLLIITGVGLSILTYLLQFWFRDFLLLFSD